MLRLIESGQRAPRRAGWTVASTMLHGALIATAVAITVRQAVPAPPPIRVEQLVYSRPLPAQPRTARGGSDGAGRLPGALPAPPSFRLPGIPRVDLDLPRGFAPDASELGTPGPVGKGHVVAGSALGVGVVHDATQVDRVVAAWRDNPRPAYPTSLRAAGVGGEVVVRFVVDTNGVVEPGSVTILHTSHVLFGDAVRGWLPRTRYAPAAVRGRRVRQLVEQRVNFELTP